jgi:methylmalonyl-CoA mutase N-terminal domain/subunit
MYENKENYWAGKVDEIKKRNIHTENRYRAWKKEYLEPWNRQTGYREKEYQNTSGIKIKDVYTEEDLPHKLDEILGMPGQYPYTRGIYPNMYRGKLWTMRMFSGFGTPEDTNKRLKYLIKHGETGLSIAFDEPTLYGYDCDNKRADGEIGKCGVNVTSLKDMEVIFNGIHLDKVSTSMTINAPAAILTAMYIAVAKKQKVPIDKLAGTVQTDILKEYIAQKEWMYPPEVHLRMIRDMMTYSTKNMPKWNYISISGYHIREAGASALQELAFTLADGFYYVDMGIKAGLNVDSFAPRLSFFFNSSINFFEEIAKFRAARRIWATVLREKYGASKERTLLLRFHTQTSGYTLTWQQPMNNIIRTTIEALAAVIGGTQSLHTNSFDEALALPTEQAVKIALRTQQIIAEETGVIDTADPLGGSYYVEWLTDQMEEQAYRYFDEIEKIGGVLAAIKTGYLQKEISRTAYEHQKRLESLEEIMVGVNKYQEEEEKQINILKIDKKPQKVQIDRVREVRKNRNNDHVIKALEEYRNALINDKENVMPYILKAVEEYATLEEISNVGRDLYGGWKEPEFI